MPRPIRRCFVIQVAPSTEMFNDRPEFIEALAEVVEDRPYLRV